MTGHPGWSFHGRLLVAQVPDTHVLLPCLFFRVHALFLWEWRQVWNRPQQHPQTRRVGGEQHCAGRTWAPQEGFRLLPQQLPGRCLPLSGLLILGRAIPSFYQELSSPFCKPSFSFLFLVFFIFSFFFIRDANMMLDMINIPKMFLLGMKKLTHQGS